MKIEVVGSTFHVRGGFHELADLRAIPTRVFLPEPQVWEAAKTKKNADYLWAWRDHATPDALGEMQKLRAGVVTRGVLPDGYDFKLELYPHQLDTLLRGVDKESYAYLLDPGLGKTAVCIHDFRIANMRAVAEAALIVAPNSILSNWEEEIAKHSPAPMNVRTYDPSKKGAIATWMVEKSADPKVLLMAVETFSSGEGRDFAERFLQLQPTAIYLDESSRIKTHNSARTKALLAVAKHSVRRRIATGTCITKGVQDAWAQFQFLDPKIINRNYFAFRAKHCVMGHFKNIIGNRDVDIFIDQIAPHSVVYRKQDCLKLPPRVFQVRKVTPTPAQKEIYTQLRKKGIVELERGAVSFTNALVRDLRLQQIAGGFVAVEEDLARASEEMALAVNITMEVAEQLISRIRTEPIPGKNPKLEELMLLFEEIPSKTICWCRFKPEIRMIAEAIRSTYGPNSVVEFHGDIDQEGRTLARQRFQEDPECRFFVGQIATGGLGITLTAGEVSVYFSNDWSIENRLQSMDRNYRIGTTVSPIYIDLVMDGWVDSKIHAALSAGKDYVADMIESIRQSAP